MASVGRSFRQGSDRAGGKLMAMSHWARLPLLIAVRLVTRVPAVAAAVALLVFAAPGFHFTERDLDLRLDSDTIRQRQARPGAGQAFGEALRWITGTVKGDLGESTVYSRPVSELLVERTPVTLRLCGTGLILGWTGALALALAGAAARHPVLAIPGMAASALVVSVPAALLGFLALLYGIPVRAAVAAIVFARVYIWVSGMLSRAAAQPWVTAARAAGLARSRIVIRHILPGIVPQMLAVFAGSVTLVLGAAVPLEVVCDIPGLGQLAWKATLGRDLPLLLPVTLTVCAVAIAAACISDTASSHSRRWAE